MRFDAAAVPQPLLKETTVDSRSGPDQSRRPTPGSPRTNPAGVRDSRSSPRGLANASPRRGHGSRVRCAIYTRKSSEEGLAQELNSLDAQREACESYVRSRKHEGWQVLPQLYDDPGYSGGNMERPALVRLLADISAGKIDVVVVYRVDRLTRALAYFSKIVEVFDANQASFVSITQAFNTTTSMGRLMLNVLLSFAQFEREVTGERIRDKIAASKKKGMWMGGLPSLGYDVKDRKLVVNEAEAATVRTMFQTYLEHGSVRELKVRLDADGVVSKLRTAADGSSYGGNKISRGALYQMLQNRIYRGEIVHKGAAHPGEHQPIIDAALWDAVQKKLEANGVERSMRAPFQVRLLAGVLFDANGEPMTPTHAVKKGVRYSYYVSRRLITGRRGEGSRDRHSGQRAPAINLERLVVQRLRAFFADPDAVKDALPSRRRDAPSVKRALAAAQAIIRTIDRGKEDLTTFVLRPLLARVIVGLDRIEIELGEDANAEALLADDQTSAAAPSRTLASGNVMTREADEGRLVRLTVPARLQRAGQEMKFVVEGADDDRAADPALLRLLVRARTLARRLAGHSASTLEEAGAQENMGAPYAARLMRLNFLAPDIVVAILNGRQPAGLTATKLMADTRLPLGWSAQRLELGFA